MTCARQTLADPNGAPPASTGSAVRVDRAERLLATASNNFNLVRLACAATICLAHAAALRGAADLQWVEEALSSSVRIQAFFVISGFLIFRSYERASSTVGFARRRLRRIYPPYCGVVLLCAFSLGFISSTPADYFSREWLQYVAANLSFLNFLHPHLPGVFEEHRYTAVNGALWTLKIEMMFYAAVPLFVFLFRRAGHGMVIAGTYCLSVGYAMLMRWLAETTGTAMYDELGRQLPGQLAYLIAGGFLYYYFPLLHGHRWLSLAFALGVLLIDVLYPLPLLQPVALAVAIVYISVFIPGPRTRRLGNLSYAIFLIHFPIIQVIVHAGIARHSPAVYVATVVTIVAVASVTLWRLMDWYGQRTARPAVAVAPSEPGGRLFQDLVEQKQVREQRADVNRRVQVVDQL